MLRFTLEVWEKASKIHRDSLSPAEKQVILDQVNFFWQGKGIPHGEEEIAKSYAVALADMLYLSLFNPSIDSKVWESVRQLKSLINTRWARRS